MTLANWEANYPNGYGYSTPIAMEFENSTLVSVYDERDEFFTLRSVAIASIVGCEEGNGWYISDEYDNNVEIYVMDGYYATNDNTIEKLVY